MKDQTSNDQETDMGLLIKKMRSIELQWNGSFCLITDKARRL